MIGEKPTGVFVRLPLSFENVMEIRRHILGKCITNDAIVNGIRAIGTPVTGGELPTEVVRVREYRKDIELPWTYHKVPPSDQDASEYELEVDWMLTHKQALAKLAEKDAEIMRLRDALRGIIDTAHNLPEFMRIETMQKEAELALKGPEA